MTGVARPGAHAVAALHRRAEARSVGLCTAALVALVLAVPSHASQPGQDPDQRADQRPDPNGTLGGPWGRMTVLPGGPVDMRPTPPRIGRKRCLKMNGIAGAQMFGDSAMELTMKDGGKYRLFFARECPALSFYQGFYYRRSKAGQLCAGRDAIGARSGGECAIASIIPVPGPRR